MSDFRRYTGTQRLQALWGVFSLIGFVVTLVWEPAAAEQPLSGGIVGILAIVGLLMLGLRERRNWNRMVELSSFDHERGTRPVDLEKLLRNRSVYATTTVPGLLAQTHLEVSTRVDGVEAEFSITIRYVGSGGDAKGIQIGTDAIDEAFVIRGTERNVTQVLSVDVQAALLDVETPGTCTITNEAVEYVVPFTSVSANELEAISTAVVEIADRVESVAKGGI